MSNQLTKETRSCFDCKHSKVWTDKKNKAGFECTHPSLTEDENWVEPECYLTMTHEEFALYCARTCIDYAKRNLEVSSVKTIKFMNDHCTTSLWWDSHGKVEPLEYDELPLSKELVNLLEKRDEEYTNRLNWEDPASTPNPTEEELIAFEAERITLWKRLQEELKPFYKVTFFSEVLRRVVETEAELDA